MIVGLRLSGGMGRGEKAEESGNRGIGEYRQRTPLKDPTIAVSELWAVFN